jgi:ribokinase
MADHCMRLSGGKAANQAFLAQRLGHTAMLLGRVGDDDLAEQALAPLRRAGLRLDGVAAACGTATAVSMIAAPPDAKKGIVLAANANDAWDEAVLRTMELTLRAAPSDAVLSLDCEVAPDAVARVLSQIFNWLNLVRKTEWAYPATNRAAALDATSLSIATDLYGSCA